ncbi:MAG: LPXTG cell wall anchor domain-containing protein, partial [Lachnospiraceae bacterium]|nr:LPXTG cell wall anchor domain-containing protein [Lachnospiraceae bacterium]
NNPPSNPPSGGNNNPPSPPPSGDNNPPSPPPSGGGNNPGPNPPSGESNDSTTQSDTDSATTNMVDTTGASAGRDTSTLSNMTSAQTGERKLPWAVFGGSMSMIFIAGTVYVFKKKEKIEE